MKRPLYLFLSVLKFLDSRVIRSFYYVKIKCTTIPLSNLLMTNMLCEKTKITIIKRRVVLGNGIDIISLLNSEMYAMWINYSGIVKMSFHCWICQVNSFIYLDFLYFACPCIKGLLKEYYVIVSFFKKTCIDDVLLIFFSLKKKTKLEVVSWTSSIRHARAFFLRLGTWAWPTKSSNIWPLYFF
jgi:hypothetical protein